jgi:O-antigen/teichoic acid export membrane protein
MAGSQKILAALHANWSLNLIGLLLSYGASIVLVRAMHPELFAEYAAAIGLIALASLVFEAGANSGLTRYLAEAEKQGARGTFYRRMQSRRWLAAVGCVAVLGLLGPLYARSTHFDALTAQPWLFAIVGATVAATLLRLLAHYGLIALFETKAALLLQQGFQVGRAVLLAGIALVGGSLAHLLGTLLALAAIEALIVHRRFWGMIREERAPLPEDFISRAQQFGLLTVFEKVCAMLGGGTFLMLVLAPQHAVLAVAFFALAIDLVGKGLSLTAMPMGNLVAPFLSHTSDDPAAQGRAIGRVVKLSSLLYCFSVGAGLLLIPTFVPAVYGASYSGAVVLALVLLVPTAFESWVRGSCSPALLRNGRYRELLRVNVLQAVLSLTTLALVYRKDLAIAIGAVGAVRCAVAALNLAQVRALVPAGTFRVPLQGLLISGLCCALAHSWGALLPLPGLARGGVQVLAFALFFYAGLRWVILRDEDTLHLAHRITGSRIRPLARLLPPAPLPHA